MQLLHIKSTIIMLLSLLKSKSQVWPMNLFKAIENAQYIHKQKLSHI